MANSLATVRPTVSGPDGHADGHSAVRGVRSDAAEFDRIVADHRERIARLAYRLLGWRDEVEDVVQEVFLAAFRNRETFRAESSLTTWLTTIAINKCRSHLRKRLLRRLFFERSWQRLAGPVDGADGAVLERESFEQVRRALQKLPTRHREVVVLRYLEEMSIAEIAEVLEVSRNAVEVRLNRARARLKADLRAVNE